MNKHPASLTAIKIQIKISVNCYTIIEDSCIIHM
jgi:hypothetical protein